MPALTGSVPPAKMIGIVDVAAVAASVAVVVARCGDHRHLMADQFHG
jgi:hypothetical protein